MKPKFYKELEQSAKRNESEFDPQAMYVTFKITSAGELEQEVQNGDGVNCLALTEELEAARGGVTSRQMKAGCDSDETRRTRIVTNDRQRI